MLSCLNANRPPIIVITKTTTIRTRCFSANATMPSMLSIRPAHAARVSCPSAACSSSCRLVDEQAALGHNRLTRLQALHHLHHAGAGDAGLDLADLQRLV